MMRWMISVKQEITSYGAVGMKCNCPGKRMLSSMTSYCPTINTISCGWHRRNYDTNKRFSNYRKYFKFKMSTSDAVNKTRFHHQWLPDQIMVEKEFPNR